ncbi:DUF3278 domain-containing protein [Lactiplantibacillus daowaiensis]|uniref:DUF3278 domain-containing protein n=1 Tax=Lactiplantibacillus daowaiensis TaxID=2559918 RepID=A0ABW1S2K6_9LACO
MKPEKGLILAIKQRFFGVPGKLDQQKLNQINRIGNNAFLILFGYTLVANLVVAMLSVAHPKQVLMIFVFVNIFFTLFVVLTYLAVATMRLGLDQHSVTAANYPQAVQQVKWRAIRMGIYLGLYLWLVARFLDWFFRGIAYQTGVLMVSGYVQALGLGVIGGLVMYGYWRLQLKRQL